MSEIDSLFDFSEAIESKYAEGMLDFISAFYTELLGTETTVSMHEEHDVNKLFEAAIYKTIEEIDAGADPYDFREQAIMNFIIIAADDGMKTLQIQEFVRELQKD